MLYITKLSLLLCLMITLNKSLLIAILFTIIMIGVAICLIIKIVQYYRKKKQNKSCMLSATSYNYFDYLPKPNIPKRSRALQVEELNKDLAPFGFAYYPKEDIFYSIMNGWQRKCGYCELYDEGSAALSMIIDCEPIRFEYNGKQWLIELWKGQYGMNTGCEIGIYNTTGPNLNIPDLFDGTFYNSAKDDEKLYMELELRKNGELLFTRNELHWWLTGFKLGEFSEPSELSMSAEITFKDSEMRDAFIGGLLETGYSRDEFDVTGNTIRLVYDKPHSPQPATRTHLNEYIMQTNNKRNCEAYQIATKNYPNTLDKLDYVKSEAPKMYRRIINVGSTKEFFQLYESISDFMNQE